MTYQYIRADRDEDVVVLTLNRPEKLNAWTPFMRSELMDAIQAADSNPNVGAVIVTGAGRAFCAGADMDRFAQRAGGQPAPYPDDDRNWIDVVRSTKPIVAAVNGVAAGIGATMILPFDRIIGSERARFALRFVRLGLVPEGASSWFAQLRIGFAAASDLMLSGRIVEGSEAFDLGLVDQLVPHDDLLPAAKTSARQYCGYPSQAVKWTKELLTVNAAPEDVRTVEAREMELLEKAWKTPQFKEAVAAFLEKREPDFSQFES